jgi:cell pole-organizing protein PopZ
MVTGAADVTMATANNAQREPSMEEILASIRKIIEDSDSGRRAADDGLEPAQESDARVAGTTIADMDAFRAELRGGLDGEGESAVLDGPEVNARPIPTHDARQDRPDASLPRIREEGHSPSLAEIGARVAMGRDGVSGLEENLSPPMATEAAAVEPPVVAAAQPFSATEKFGETEKRPEIGRRDEVEQGKGSPAPEAAAENAGPLPVRNAVSTGGQTLISEQTGRQVAAAFGELSEAFGSRNRKSLDEMAEEMLRPMLQDWLDNNLPTLVERLVREEIERVARGG